MVRSFFAASVLASVAGLANASVVFQSNFDNINPNPSNLTGGHAVDGQGFKGRSAQGSTNAFGGCFYRVTGTGNASCATLVINNLGPHTGLSIKFLLAVIDSWDGNGGSPGPDAFAVKVDDVTVFSKVFASASGSGNYTPPAGGLIFSGQNVGFSSWNDAGYDMSVEPSLQNIPHTASSVTIKFCAVGNGWQGGDDESFALDNIKVEKVIPTPGSLAAIGLVAFGAARRRRA